MSSENQLVKYLCIFACIVAVFYVLDKNFSKKNEGFESEQFKDSKLYRDSKKNEHFEHQQISQDSASEAAGDVNQQQAQQAQALKSASGDRDQLKPSELLPTDQEASAWSKVNPKGKGSLEFKNFLEAGYHLGMNTQTNTLRNANLQIRSEPPNPQVPISIFNNSTIGFDTNRRPLEIGCGE